MIISLVVAVAENGVIGRDGTLPWRISADLRTFRRLTMGKPLIMGRRTFQSLKKPLDGRDNIVITRDADYRPAGAIIAHDFVAALEAALPLAHRIYKTEVHASPAGDAFFPHVDWGKWLEVSRESLPRGPNDDCTSTLVILERRQG